MHKSPKVRIGQRWLGEGQPTYVVAEIGVNHNGSLELALDLVEGAAKAGASAVKFQKRSPEDCVPREQWGVMRDTPWGRMSYLDYRYKVELDEAAYRAIDARCRQLGIDWFASCWDAPSVAFIERFDPPCHKVASATITDDATLDAIRATAKPVICSTGMSSLEQIDAAVARLGSVPLVLCHTVSLYPCPVESLNLRVLSQLRERYPEAVVGYSGHEAGLVPTFAAVALGASFVERHVTLDRTMWGSDQAASVELTGLARLVAGIRDIERALGDGVKVVLEGERAQARKLRRTPESELDLPSARTVPAHSATVATAATRAMNDRATARG